MRFTGKLPKGFVLSKPIDQKHYKETVVLDLEKRGRLIKTRKRDGWKLFAAVDANRKVRLYTDGMNEVDARLAHIREEIETWRLPSNSLVVGEVLFDRDDNDDLGSVQSVMQGSLENAVANQKKRGLLRYMLFGVLYLKGVEVAEPFRENLASISELFFGKPERHIFKVPVLDLPLDKAKELVRARGWEGLVLYDAGFMPEIRLDGKDPERPKGCYKWKPVLEDDFIVRERILGPDGTVKKLVLLQIDPRTDKEFCCGTLTSFTNAKRKELAAEPLPLVVQAEFEARFAKTGKIRSARYVRVRTDKKVRDCIAPKSYGKA